MQRLDRKQTQLREGRGKKRVYHGEERLLNILSAVKRSPISVARPLPPMRFTLISWFCSGVQSRSEYYSAALHAASP